MPQLHVTEGTELSDGALEALMAVAVSISECTNLVVQAGAGISTNAGIPDFRSNLTGIYSGTARRVPTRQAATSTRSAKDMFTYASIIDPATRPLHLQVMANLRAQCRGTTTTSDVKAPTVFHSLLKRLDAIDKLLRVYSQNVDGLEQDAGLQFVDFEQSEAPEQIAARSSGCDDTQGDSSSDYEDSVRGQPPRKRSRGSQNVAEQDRWYALPRSQRVVAMHGSLRSVICAACQWKGDWNDEIQGKFQEGKRVDCPRCSARSELRLSASKRRLPTASLSFLRPNLVLYDDPTSSSSSHLSALSSLSNYDLSSGPDFLLVAGTSLLIPGFKRLVRSFAREVAANGGICVLVNREPVASTWDQVFDYEFRMDTDLFAGRLLENLASIYPCKAIGESTAPSLSPSTLKRSSHSSSPTIDSRQTPSPSRPTTDQGSRYISHLPTPSPTPSLASSTSTKISSLFEPVLPAPFKPRAVPPFDADSPVPPSKRDPRGPPSPPPTSSPIRPDSNARVRPCQLPPPRVEGRVLGISYGESRRDAKGDVNDEDDSDKDEDDDEDDEDDEDASRDQSPDVLEVEAKRSRALATDGRIWTDEESRSLVDELMREAERFWQEGQSARLGHEV